ncbi:AMP-binding protein [Bradyrhizobium sp. BR 1432]|uniref:AMP-binding protein n=1 Tax=Bradyrhizobium sp. BR 1432 TaxID=3447966 RepID=UPI003EE7E84C
MVLDRAISVSDILRATACATPQKDAVVDEAGSLTYREFDETVDRLAAGLQRLGVGSGDRVAYLLWNQRELLLSYFSIARLGALTVSLNFRLTAEELAYQLSAAQCKALIVDEELAGLASQAIANSGPQIQLIVCGNGERPDQLRFDDLLGGSTEDIPSFPIVSSDADSGIWFTSGTSRPAEGSGG